jgi:glycosyltransferase involved in cell wall biosynthesis
VHRITPLSPTSQSSLARKCDREGVAFILGPLNGGVPWPAGFDRERRQEREWLSYVRALYKLLPTRRSTLRYTRALLIGSHHTLNELPAVIRQKCVYLPENAIDPARFNRVSVQLDCRRLRICFVGRLVPYKGPDMLLEAAMPLLRRGAMTLDFVGDGPLMDRLRADVAGGGVSSAVNFHGWVPHTNVQDVMCQCHAMALPSVREFGGGVVLEAMALGVVPIVVDYAGPSELVDSEVGHKIPIGCRPEVVLHLRETLEKLAADPGALAELSRAGRRRVMQHYTWSAKATQVLSVYEWALGRQASKPEFDFRSSVSSVSRP